MLVVRCSGIEMSRCRYLATRLPSNLCPTAAPTICCDMFRRSRLARQDDHDTAVRPDRISHARPQVGCDTREGGRGRQAWMPEETEISFGLQTTGLTTGSNPNIMSAALEASGQRIGVVF